MQKQFNARVSVATERRDHPHACWDGYIFLGYTDEDGEEAIEVLPCRRCAKRAEYNPHTPERSTPTTLREAN